MSRYEPEGPPLTEMEIAAWLENLDTSDTGRAIKLRELLDHAGEDTMHPYDRGIIARSLAKLETKARFRMVK